MFRHARIVFLCAFASVGAAQAQAPEATSLALPSTSLTFSGAYLARDLGIFEKNGLDLKLLDINGVGSPNAVISGTVDFTLTTGSTFARAALRGQRMLIIANMIERPQMELVLKSSIATQGGFDPKAPVIERGKLLKGRTIGIDGVFTNLHAWMQLVARKAGLDPEKDIKVTPLPAANMLAAMAAGTIDGFSSSLPWTISTAMDGSAVILASSFAEDAPEIIPFAYSVLVTRPEVCKERRSVCEKMARSFAEAARILREEPERAAGVLRKRFPQIPDAVLTASLDMIRRSTPASPKATIEGLENSERFNVSAGILKAEDTLKSWDGLFTDEFLR